MLKVNKTNEFERYSETLKKDQSITPTIISRVSIIIEIKSIWCDMVGELNEYNHHEIENAWSPIWNKSKYKFNNMILSKSIVKSNKVRIINESESNIIEKCQPGQLKALKFYIQCMVNDSTHAKQKCINIPSLSLFTDSAIKQKLCANNSGLSQDIDILLGLNNYSNYVGDIESLCFHNMIILYTDNKNFTQDSIGIYGYGWALKAGNNWYGLHDMTNLCDNTYGYHRNQTTFNNTVILGIWHMFMCVHGLCKCSISNENEKKYIKKNSDIDIVIGSSLYPQAVTLIVIVLENTLYFKEQKITVEEEVILNIYVTYGNAMYSILRDILHDTQHSILWFLEGKSWIEKVVTLLEDNIALTILACGLQSKSERYNHLCSAFIGSLSTGIFLRRYSILNVLNSPKKENKCVGICKTISIKNLWELVFKLIQPNNQYNNWKQEIIDNNFKIKKNNCCENLFETAKIILGIISDKEILKTNIKNTIYPYQDKYDKILNNLYNFMLTVNECNNPDEIYSEINKLFIFMETLEKTSFREVCIHTLQGVWVLLLIITTNIILQNADEEENQNL